MADKESRYQQVVRLAEAALNYQKSQGKDKSNARELLSYVQAEFPSEADDVTPSWSAYLTRASQDPEISIVREPGKYGFLLEDRPSSKEAGAEPILNDEDGRDDAEPRGYAQREATLYGVLRSWLSSRDYQADIPASTKKGGYWGNPDVAGIKVLDDPLGNQHMELATVEAKISDANWKRYFFEAVAHKRFAHRAYFAFAVGASEAIVAKVRDYEELREYGERYNVGILVVFIEPDTYERLRADIDVSRIELGDVRVEEIWPAAYEEVPPQPLTNYVANVLELRSSSEVHTYGRDG